MYMFLSGQVNVLSAKEELVMDLQAGLYASHEKSGQVKSIPTVDSLHSDACQGCGINRI